MRNILCLILLFVFSKVLSQEVVIENDSLLLWQADRPLEWGDFKGIPKPVRFHNAAGTGPFIKYIYSTLEGRPPEFTFFTYFDKCRSWTVTNSSEILEHEQLHFDIAELYTRKIRKRFDSLVAEYVTNKDIYFQEKQKIDTEYHECQNKYDHEVLANYPKFLEWRKRIAKELEELKEYEYVPEE